VTERDHELDAVRRAAELLLPELSRRLERHGLGELEVRRGDLRLRLRAGPRPLVPRPSVEHLEEAHPRREAEHEVPGRTAVTAPAVGIFYYGEGLGPGLPVETGDRLGRVEMLGVPHDVRAPQAGTVSNLVAETGEAVEYGQLLVELAAADER
jgi:biotin carboxyl carrier protein